MRFHLSFWVYISCFFHYYIKKYIKIGSFPSNIISSKLLVNFDRFFENSNSTKITIILKPNILREINVPCLKGMTLRFPKWCSSTLYHYWILRYSSKRQCKFFCIRSYMFITLAGLDVKIPLVLKFPSR